MPRDFLVMAKPGGARCNLACSYCYYLGKDAALPPGPPRMDDALLERFIAQRIATAGGGEALFEWHGGEPTCLGPEYFRKVVRLQKKHSGGARVRNCLQTNGQLIDRDWARFLARESFAVGLSIDGPAELHDAFRKGAAGGGSHAKAERAWELLRAEGVRADLLCVLHARNAAEPERVYRYFRGLGARFLQFLPLVKRLPDGSLDPACARPGAIGDFLLEALRLWLAEGLGSLVVQAFDEALRPFMGLPHALCVHRATCGDVLVLERDGGLYACDHFVDAARRVGSLRERDLAALASDPALLAFGEAKRAGLPPDCLECEWLRSCNGGCPKDRFMPASDGTPRLNYLCPAYKAFFSGSAPVMEQLARHLKSGSPLRAFRVAGD